VDANARKTATVTAEERRFLLFIGGERIGAVPRTTAREIHRYQAYARNVEASAASDSATQEDPPAMTEISTAVQIDAPPQQVWAILADLASYAQWNPLFREASGQLTAGSTVTLKTVRPGTRRVTTIKVKVLAAEPGAQLRWVSSLPGIITGEHSFTLTPADGGTQLVQTETYRGLLSHMSAKSISRAKASFEALNQAIKYRAEHDQQTTPE
jgi:hypothetical protein